MFTHNYRPAIGLTSEQKANEYFILYYQFFKNAFGFEFCNCSDSPIGLKIYFDQLPDTVEKNSQFKNFIYNLQFREPFDKANLTIKEEDVGKRQTLHTYLTYWKYEIMS